MSMKWAMDAPFFRKKWIHIYFETAFFFFAACDTMLYSLAFVLSFLLPFCGAEEEEEGEKNINNVTSTGPGWDNETYFERPHPFCTEMIRRDELRVRETWESRYVL